MHKAQVETLLSVDDAVRKLMRALKSTGRQRDTLFIFLSDNGYFWGEHGLLGKDAPYDAGLRIPMVVRWDGQVPAGVTDDRLALNVDLAGTISRVASAGMTTDGLDLLGSASPHRVRRRGDGRVRRPAGVLRLAHPAAISTSGGPPAGPSCTTTAATRTSSTTWPATPPVAGLKHRMRAHAMKACSPEPPGFDW